MCRDVNLFQRQDVQVVYMIDQSHVTENILFALVIEAQEDVGAVDCGLIHIHGGVRLLIHRHAVHTLKESKQAWVITAP